MNLLTRNSIVLSCISVGADQNGQTAFVSFCLDCFCFAVFGGLGKACATQSLPGGRGKSSDFPMIFTHSPVPPPLYQQHHQYPSFGCSQAYVHSELAQPFLKCHGRGSFSEATVKRRPWRCPLPAAAARAGSRAESAGPPRAPACAWPPPAAALPALGGAAAAQAGGCRPVGWHGPSPARPGHLLWGVKNTGVRGRRQLQRTNQREARVHMSRENNSTKLSLHTWAVCAE